MQKLTAALIAFLLILSTLVSCGEAAPEPADGSAPSSDQISDDLPVSSEEESEPETEPQTEPGYSYVPPEDGSFTVCGTDLSEYTMMLYFPGNSDYSYMDRKALVTKLEGATESATGWEQKMTIVKNERFDTTPKTEHEILFGINFQREGMPEPDPKKNYYGVTADGTVFFCSSSPILYPYLYSLFLEEFFGVPAGSGERSRGCALEECYREIPLFDPAELEASGYSLVFEDNFDGDALNLDVWKYRSTGARRGGFNSASQVTVADGYMTIKGSYLEDGEFGPGWYAAMVSLQEFYLYGYFEASIKCSECLGRGSDDFWSAFWIQGPAPYTPDQSQGGPGPGGAELDVMENWGPDASSSCIWVSGVEGKGTDLSQELYEVRHLGNNYPTEFHTFSMLWDADFYRIYVDGQLVCCSDFAYGTSTVPEEVILSLETNYVKYDHSIEREMVVDYLRIWQKSENP